VSLAHLLDLAPEVSVEEGGRLLAETASQIVKRAQSGIAFVERGCVALGGKLAPN